MPDGKRPEVAIACATSLDGKLSTAARDPVRFTSRRDRARLHELRDASCAILVGARTLRAEDPPLLPTADHERARLAAGVRALPVRAVASRSLEVPVGRALAAREGSPVYVFTPAAPPAKRAALEATGLRVREVPDLGAALDVLAREEGVRRVLAEGGGELNAALLEADLVGAIELTISPVIIGGAGAPTLVDGSGLPSFKRARLVAHEATPEGELFLRYEIAPA